MLKARRVLDTISYRRSEIPKESSFSCHWDADAYLRWISLNISHSLERCPTQKRLYYFSSEASPLPLFFSSVLGTAFQRPVHAGSGLCQWLQPQPRDRYGLLHKNSLNKQSLIQLFPERLASRKSQRKSQINSKGTKLGWGYKTQGRVEMLVYRTG